MKKILTKVKSSIAIEQADGVAYKLTVSGSRIMCYTFISEKNDVSKLDDLTEVLTNYADTMQFTFNLSGDTETLLTYDDIVELWWQMDPSHPINFAFIFSVLTGLSYRRIKTLKFIDLNDTDLKRSCIIRNASATAKKGKLEHSDWHCLVKGHFTSDDDLLFELPNKIHTYPLLDAWACKTFSGMKPLNWRMAKLSYYFNQLLNGKMSYELLLFYLGFHVIGFEEQKKMLA